MAAHAYWNAQHCLPSMQTGVSGKKAFEGDARVAAAVADGTCNARLFDRCN